MQNLTCRLRHSSVGAAKGGRARAQRLSSARRREIARAAASARWRRR
jgi:hypothetical protein